MSSLTEKVLMIGFGATICLSLFSAIAPLLSQIQVEYGTSSYNRDIIKFYQMETEIKRNSQNAIQIPEQDFRIHYDFSTANSIQLSKINNSTLGLEMILEVNEIFHEIIKFEINITIWRQNSFEEVEFVSWTKMEERDESIEVIYDLYQYEGILYFEV